jgi:uncharacterized protein Yka (UPF0111/DUF47 family)
MDWLKRFLNPPQSNFPELLQQHGEYAIASVEALQDYLKKPGTKRSVQARKTEKHADEIQRILIHELEDTFVTPLDREDIFALSRAIDNFIDYVYDTVAELEIFELTPSDSMKTVANLLLEMANELHLATQRLFDHPRVANEHARRIISIENQVETTYRHSIVELFSGPEDTAQIMEMLKSREVLRHMSNASDQGERAADIILDIGIKWS